MHFIRGGIHFMKDLSLTQKFFICTVNEKGNFSSYDQVPVACLIAAGVLEMYIGK